MKWIRERNIGKQPGKRNLRPKQSVDQKGNPHKSSNFKPSSRQLLSLLVHTDDQVADTADSVAAFEPPGSPHAGETSGTADPVTSDTVPATVGPPAGRTENPYIDLDEVYTPDVQPTSEGPTPGDNVKSESSLYTDEELEELAPAAQQEVKDEAKDEVKSEDDKDAIKIEVKDESESEESVVLSEPRPVDVPPPPQPLGLRPRTRMYREPCEASSDDGATSRRPTPRDRGVFTVLAHVATERARKITVLTVPNLIILVQHFAFAPIHLIAAFVKTAQMNAGQDKTIPRIRITSMTSARYALCT